MALVAIQQIRPVHAEPGGLFETPAPAIGSAPPTASTIQDGDASVSETGALKYGYPIQVPPGRHGMQPHLSLAYSSQAPIYGGIASGWSLSGIPIITLDTSQGRLLGRTFASSMAGGRPLVAVDEPSSDGAPYRAQNDSTWVRYQKMSPGYTYSWRALALDGTIYYFGDHGGSDAHTVGCDIVDDEYAPLTRESDAFGNLVEYFYTPGVAGECRIDHITWGQNGGAGMSEFARVTFSYNDPAPACAGVPVGSLTSYRSGKPIVTGGSELTTITATAYEPGQYQTPEHTRVITLSYSSTDKACTANHGAFRSLTSIQESAQFATPDTAVNLPPVTFTYGDANLQYPTAVSHSLPWPLGPVSPVYGFSLSSGLRPHADGEWPTVEDMLLDVDGDGLVDRVVSAPTSYNSTTNTPAQCRASWFKNLGNLQFDTQARYIDLPTLKWGHDLSDQSNPFSGGGAPGVYPGETGWERCALNYQSTAFVNSYYGGPDCPAGGSCVNGTCPNGTDCPALPPAAASPNGHSHTYLSYRWIDLNGDGMVDLVAGVAQGGLALYNLQRGNGIPGGPIPEPNDEPQIFGAFPSCPSNSVGYLSRGTYTMCNGLYPWFVYLNHGDGVFGQPRIRVSDPLLPDQIKYQPIPLETDQGDSSLTSWPNGESRGLVDLDGDGRADATVAPGILTPSAFAMFRSSTSGTFGADTNAAPFSYAAGPSDLLSRTDCTTFGSCWPIGSQGLLDINGDGLVDHWTIGTDPTTAVIDFNDGLNFATALQVGHLSARPGADWIREVWSTPCPPNQSCYIDSGARALTSRVFDMDADGRSDVLQITSPGHCQLGGQTCTTTTQACSSGDSCVFPLTSPFATHYNQGGQVCTYGQSLNCGEIGNGAPVNALANVIVVGGIDPSWYWEARADLVDLDGDGIPESVDFDGAAQSEPPTTNPHSLYLSKIATPTQPARLLATIDNHRGAITTVTYATSTSSTVEQHPELGRTLPQVHWVVQNLSTADTVAATTTAMSYHYVNPEYIADDRGTYGFRGFDEIQTTLPIGATRVDRYDFATDWSGRLKTSLVVPAEAPGEVRSIDETQWQALTLFDGALTTYHAQYVDHWTCKNLQDETACRANTDTRTRTVYFYDSPMVSSTDPEAPLLWEANRVRLQAGDAEADGDRETQNVYFLASDDQETYRLLPWSETHYSQVSGALVMFAKTAHTFDQDYKVAITDKIWNDANELDAAVTMRAYDNTGNVVQRWKPEQWAANSYPAYYTYDSRQLFVSHEKSEPVGYGSTAPHEFDYTYEYGTGTKLDTLGPDFSYCSVQNPPNCVTGALTREEHKSTIDALGNVLTRSETFNDGGLDYGTSLHTTEINSYVFSNPQSVTHYAALYKDANWSITYRQDRTDLDGHGRPIKKTVFLNPAPPNEVTTYHWSNEGTLTSVDVPDPAANDASVVTYHYTYDSLGRALTLTRPDGGTPASGATITYDGLTQTTTEQTGAAGGLPASTTTTNDAFGRLVTVEEQVSASSWARTVYGYDPADRVKQITDPEGHVTTIGVDLAGRRTSITRGTRVWTYGYDRNGNMVSVTTPCTGVGCAASYTTTIVYDNLDEPTSKLVPPRGMSLADRQYFGIDHEQFRWDYLPSGGGNNKGLLSYWLSYGPSAGFPKVEVNKGYTAQGRVRRVNEFFNDSLGGYAPLSRSVALGYHPSGAVNTEAFLDSVGGSNLTSAVISLDRRGLPSQMQVLAQPRASQTIAVATRNVAGLVTKQRTDQTGSMPYIESDWTYDHLGRVTSQLVQAGPGSTQVVRQDLAYFGNDDPKSLDHWLGNSNHKQFTYTFDWRHQLTQVDETMLPHAFTATYEYGDAGRFRTATEASAGLPGTDVKPRGVTYHYDPADPEEVTSLTTGSNNDPFAVYTYDDEGNQTSRCYGGTSGGVCAGESVEYLYDGKDQLRRATKKLVGVVQGSEEYWYDDDGGRVATLKRDASGAKTELIWFLRDVEAHYDAAGTLTHVYSYLGLGGPAAARIDRTGNASTAWEYLFHGLGNSTLAAVDRDTGLVDASFDYAPFGEVVESTDAGGASGAGTAAHRRRMNDKFVDEISDLTYYGTRYYDKTSLTWTQADPQYRFVPDLGRLSTPRRANLYTFSLQNPLRYMDPDGRDSAPSVWNPTGNDPHCNGRTSVCDDGGGDGRGSRVEDPKPYDDTPVRVVQAMVPSRRTAAMLALAGLSFVPYVGIPARILLGGLIGGENAGCVTGCSVADAPGAGAAADASAIDVAADGAAGRTFTSTDPLVSDLANQIEKEYPGHVVGVNVPVLRADGTTVTDIDILTKNAAIQVKSGGGKGLGAQMEATAAATGLPTIGYGPSLGLHVYQDIQEAGGLVTRDAQLLIKVVAP